MGLDLTILPQYDYNADFSHDLISLHRDSDLFDLIKEIENKIGVEVPEKGIYSYTGKNKTFDGICYGKTIKKPCGYVMKSVLAGELKKVLANYKTKSWKNKAFIAFLNEMPDNLEVWLYWH
jgi:hypothetical protein